MAQLNFGGVTENVVTREEFPLEKAQNILKNQKFIVKYKNLDAQLQNTMF